MSKITEGTKIKFGSFERTVERVINHPAGRWARYVGAPVGDHGNSIAYLERAVENGTATIVKTGNLVTEMIFDGSEESYQRIVEWIEPGEPEHTRFLPWNAPGRLLIETVDGVVDAGPGAIIKLSASGDVTVKGGTVPVVKAAA